mmetsp:Transcript_27839/g.66964  ORF Transcript_27839/g.66964 Transcript_27839/m.66964 type:complete len:302 (+) Transcript_27839:1425-2330(+)
MGHHVIQPDVVRVAGPPEHEAVLRGPHHVPILVVFEHIVQDDRLGRVGLAVELQDLATCAGIHGAREEKQPVSTLKLKSLRAGHKSGRNSDHKIVVLAISFADDGHDILLVAALRERRILRQVEPPRLRHPLRAPGKGAKGPGIHPVLGTGEILAAQIHRQHGEEVATVVLLVLGGGVGPLDQREEVPLLSLCYGLPVVPAHSGPEVPVDPADALREKYISGLGRLLGQGLGVVLRKRHVVPLHAVLEAEVLTLQPPAHARDSAGAGGLQGEHVVVHAVVHMVVLGCGDLPLRQLRDRPPE